MLGLIACTAMAQVQSLVGELRFHKPSQIKQNERNNNNNNKNSVVNTRKVEANVVD